MSKAEIKLRIEKSLVTEVETRAGQSGVSDYVSDAIQTKLQHDRIRELLSEMDQESGPVRAEVLEGVRKEWPTPTSHST